METLVTTAFDRSSSLARDELVKVSDTSKALTCVGENGAAWTASLPIPCFVKDVQAIGKPLLSKISSEAIVDAMTKVTDSLKSYKDLCDKCGRPTDAIVISNAESLIANMQTLRCELLILSLLSASLSAKDMKKKAHGIKKLAKKNWEKVQSTLKEWCTTQMRNVV